MYAVKGHTLIEQSELVTAAESPRPVVRVTLFGGVRLHLPPTQAGGEPEVIEKFETRRVAALLAYLALYQDREHTREQLAELLWPEEDPGATRSRLRQALAAFRRALPPDDPSDASDDLLLADRLTVRLAPDRFRVDALEFNAHLREARRAAEENKPVVHLAALRRAAALYTNPLFPDLYDSWATQERNNYSTAYQQLLLDLSEACAAIGNWDDATMYAQRAIGADPLNEEAHRTLMRGLAATGRSADALRQYTQLEKSLREELDTPPSPETTTLAQRIRSGEVSAAPATVPAAAPPPTPVAAPTLPSVLPQPELPATSVPVPLTRFFGREMELSWLETTLAPGTANRLVTLTGLGGSGKTRLALEAAAKLAPSYEGAVWFVSLTEADDALRVATAIVSGLQLPPPDSADPTTVLEPVVSLLRNRSALLVLDNFEQVVEQGAGLVRRLLEKLPKLTCLITSRQRLEIGGEREMPLPPLPTPYAPGRPEHLLEFPAVQLFVDRARVARPGFVLTRDNSAAVARLCAKLEGIPLAIDLVAAWSAALTPAQMLARFEDSDGKPVQSSGRETLLTSRNRDRDDRHRSLRAALDVSIDQLDTETRVFFARLSPLRGGWDMEAAEAVTGTPDVFERLLDLQRRSLALSEEGMDGTMRFRFLETVRAAAEERLRAEGSVVEDAVKRAHARFFGALVTEAEPKLSTNEQAQWLTRLDSDLDNLRAALAWSSEHDHETALRLGGDLMRYWRIRGQVTEGRRWLTEILANAGGALPATRARALNAAGAMALMQSDYTAARPLLEEALTLRREHGTPAEIAGVLNNLAGVAAEQGDYPAARVMLEESLEIFRAANDRVQMAYLLNNLGTVLGEIGEPDLAHERLTEALALRRALGNKQGVLVTLNRLAELAASRGAISTARTLHEESLVLARDIEMRPMIAAALCGIGGAALLSHDLNHARATLSESLIIFRDINSPRDIVSLLDVFAGLCLAEGEWQKAAQISGAAEELCTSHAMSIPPRHQSERDGVRERLRMLLTPEKFEEVRARGAGLPLPEAIALALQPPPDRPIRSAAFAVR
jgi:predicted ATPase/DNA-binding SARP family transcriptional activator